MDKNLNWLNEKRIERTIKSLENNNMNGYLVNSNEELIQKITELVKKDSLVACGGSQTLFETGIIDHLRSGRYNFLDRYLKNLTDTVEGLDKKYLLSEVIKEPRFQEERIITEVLKECNKSMHENVKHYRDDQMEYREYIETWVHEIKTPIASSKLILVYDDSNLSSKIYFEMNKSHFPHLQYQKQ